MKKLLRKIKAPCGKCPYKLGLVAFVQNPCPQCRLNNYWMYDQFIQGKDKFYGLKINTNA